MRAPTIDHNKRVNTHKRRHVLKKNGKARACQNLVKILTLSYQNQTYFLFTILLLFPITPFTTFAFQYLFFEQPGDV